MKNMNRDLHSTRLRLGVLALASTLALAACGGGGGSPGTTGAGATTPGTGTGTTPGTGTGTTTPVTTAKLTMVIVDGAGTAVTSLSGGQTATIKATVLGADGKPAVGAIVQFTSATAGLVDFTPGTGSALTDSNGIATVTIKPSSVTAAGAVSLTATSVVGGTTATASAGISVGAAPLTVGALSFATTPPAVLAAFSTLTLNVPVTSGGQPVSTAPGVVLNSLCSGDGTATLVPGTIDKGILAVTYTNKGCLRGTDTITASIGSSTQTINVAVGAANIGTVLFTGSNPAGTSIVLKGSGGLGRSESAQLTFKIVDQQGNGLAGVDVTFAPTTSTGNLTVSPLRATTDTSGNVTTMVSSGTIPTPVTVQASATRNGTTITGSSATLTISTGLPIQKSMSMSADKFNIEGLDYDGEIANLTILMADQYGNRISDGTAVNFVTEGGSVGTSAQGACTTTDGGCSVTLKSQAVKPTNGRVTVLAFAQGIEDFIDLNGDGQYTCTNFTDADGKATPTFRPMVDICVSGGEPFTDMGDAFLDTNTDGVYTAMENDLPFPYGHTTYSAAGNGRWGINYIRRSMELVFSGSQAFLTRQYCTAGVCRDWVTATDGDPTVVAGLSGPGCLSQMITFRVADRNNNPMPYGTAVAGADGSNVSPQSTAPATIGSTTHIGGTIHTLNIKPDTDCKAGNFSVAVTTPKGNGTQFLFKSGN
jgi:hypothetical protein